MINFRILLLFLLLSCCFLYSSRRFFAHDAAISSPNSSLSFEVTPPLFQLLPRNLQTALHLPDQSERSELYHGPRRTFLETSGHSNPAPPIQTNSSLPSALASTPASAPASGPVPTPVSNAHPPPTPLYLTLDQTDQLTRIEESLRSVGTQNTTLRLLFDSSSVGMMLATLPAATLLAPEDSAWANLTNEEGGAEVQRLLDGPSGSLILHNLLLHHVLQQHLLYADFQLSPPATAFPTLLNTSVFLSPSTGQNVFYSDPLLAHASARSNEADLSLAPLVSIQGIAALLIPNMAHLLNPAAAPSPSSQLGDASSPQGGMGMGGSVSEFSPPGGGGAAFLRCWPTPVQAALAWGVLWLLQTQRT